MKVFNASQIRDIDRYTIENEPIESVDLMERAARALSGWIRKEFSKNQDFVFIAGPGNNGGDAWALARLLFHYGYENIRFFLLGSPDKISPDSNINQQRLIEEADIRVQVINDEKDFPYLTNEDWVVDALFGSGLSRPLEGLAVQLVMYLNNSHCAGVISVDIPSGLFCDHSNTIDQLAVKAQYTLSFQFPKEAFFYAENNRFVGQWTVMPIGLHNTIIDETPVKLNYLTKREVRKLIRSRNKFGHKGTYGHALIVAGSYGMMGASVLAVKAAVRGGAGLVTSHVPRLGYQIAQISVPEALVSLDESDLIFTEVNNLHKYTAIGIGPGINTKTNTARALHKLLNEVSVPMVLDADAINILSENKDWLVNMPQNAILTPHPGEFDRLTKTHQMHSERVITQQDFSKKYGITVVLKGAHSSISYPDGTVWFNGSGNSGMATGGSGDVLTGLLCSILAQGYSVEDATKIAVYIHGKAGDRALQDKGYHALIAGDIVESIAAAFKKNELPLK